MWLRYGYARLATIRVCCTGCFREDCNLFCFIFLLGWIAPKSRERNYVWKKSCSEREADKKVFMYSSDLTSVAALGRQRETFTIMLPLQRLNAYTWKHHLQSTSANHPSRRLIMSWCSSLMAISKAVWPSWAVREAMGMQPNHTNQQ